MSESIIASTIPSTVFCRPPSACFPLYSVRKDRGEDFLNQVRQFFDSLSNFKYREIEVDGPYCPEIVFAFDVATSPQFDEFKTEENADVVFDILGWEDSLPITPFPNGDIPEEAYDNFIETIDERIDNMLYARNITNGKYNNIEITLFNPYTNENRSCLIDLKRKQAKFEDYENVKNWPYAIPIKSRYF